MKTFVDYILNLRDGVTGKLRSIRGQSDQTDKSVNRLGTTLATAFGGAAFIGSLQNLGKLGMDLEKVSTSFNVLTGSVDKGKALFEEINNLANNSAFGNMDLARNAQTLMQFGIETEKVTDTLKMLGDVSGANPERMKMLSLAFGQMSAAGRLMGQDLLQMINAGFNPLMVISEKTGRSVGELKDAMSKGQISTEMVTEAFKSATAEGGKFHGMLDQMGSTGAGRVTMLAGTFEYLKAQVGIELMNAIRPFTEILIKATQWMLEHKDVVLLVVSTLGTLVGSVLAIAGAIQAWVYIQQILNIVLAANPIGIVIVALSALAVGVMVAYNKFDKFRALIDGVWASIKKVGQNINLWLNDPLGQLGKVMGKTLAPFFEAIALVQQGKFFEAAKALGKGMFNATPVGLLNNMFGEGVGEAYNDGSENSLKDSEKQVKKDREDKKAKTDNSYWSGISMAGASGAGTNLQSGLSGVKGNSPKTFNINIEKLTGIEALTTNNMREGAQQLENELRKLLLNVLSDSQAIAVTN